jgi:hypothetical protein
MLSTGLECILQCWNSFDRVGISLYRVEMLSRRLECILEYWNAFDRVGIPLYRVGMLPKWLEYFLQGLNTFYIVVMLSTVLEYLCTGLECFR